MTARDKEEGNKAIHITLESDYAVRIVYSLARAGEAHRRPDVGGPHWGFSAIYAENHAEAGVRRYCVLLQGAHGGYILARPAGEITLRQVIEAVEGPYRFSRCLDSEYDCNCPLTEGPCPFHSVFGEVSRLVKGQTGSGDFCPECLIQRGAGTLFASYIE